MALLYRPSTDNFRQQSVTERTILPLAISYTNQTLTVLAWCCMRSAFRMFRTDRILWLRTTSESFRPRRAGLLRQFLAKLEARAADSDVTIDKAEPNAAMG